MTETPVRERRRCVFCDPPHLMDDLGDVAPGDVLRDGFCDRAQVKALRYVDELGEKERQALSGALYTPHDVAGLIQALSAEVDEEERSRIRDFFLLDGPPWKQILWWAWALLVTVGAGVAILRLFR
jgi:hypothetical protein